MRILGKRARWYLEAYARFDYRASRGNSLTNMLIGRIKGAGWFLMFLGASDTVFTRWFNFSIVNTMPWWGMIVLAVGQAGLEYSLGSFDYLKMKLAQIQSEVALRDGVSPWETEKMNRQRDDRELLLEICEKLGVESKALEEIKAKKYESFLEKKAEK